MRPLSPRRLRPWLGLAFGCLAGCAAPPLRLYVLDTPAVAVNAAPAANGQAAPGIEVRRVVLPDYLDSQDIVLRRGSEIERSNHGRWASRLSAAATDLITARLSAARPDLFITDQLLVTPARFRLVVNISRLDVSADGVAALAADWTIVPRDDSRPLLRDRAAFSVTGPVATDADVVALTNTVLDQLAARIGRDIDREMPPRH